MTILINDLHLGAVRKGGTTPTSQESLRDYMFVRFNELLGIAQGHDLIIGGDLFDSFEIAIRDWILTYTLISHWCSVNPTKTLYLMAGNHDHSPKGYKASSFEMLVTVLENEYDNVVVVGVDEFKQAGSNVWMLAHCSNQDMFDMQLREVGLKLDRGGFLILHANYANNFADNSDHSLNVKNDIAKNFADAGVTLVFAHEHQHRVEFPVGCSKDAAPVTILGNQIPSSIADCLGNDAKYYWIINGNDLERHECWNVRDEDGYAEIDWHDLGRELGNTAHFIRVVGTATSNEAAEVVDAIHKFRTKTSALVVGNAVKVDGIVEIDELPETFEAAKSFDVLQFIYEQLDSDERKVIEEIVEELQ